MLTSGPVQTEYTRYNQVAQNGMLADATPNATDTRNVETDEGIGFGLAVSQGTEDRGCILGGSAFVGITRADITLAQSTNLDIDVIAKNDNANIHVMGNLWVRVEGAVEAGSGVYYNATTGQLGNSGGELIEGAVWKTSADAGELAIVRLGNMSGNV